MIYQRKKALITGITGQDGAYLTRLLLEKGYEVHGVKRRSSSFNTQRLDDIFNHQDNKNPTLFLHYGDMTDSTNIIRLISDIRPDEIYNLAAQSHVAVSFETPEYTAQADAIGVLRLLEALRILGLHHTTKFYQASTSELFGKVAHVPQTESTPFYPRSPYAVAKLYAYWIVVHYREAYGMFASNGILFNHESPLRGETFVTRKITRAVVRIAAGLQECVVLGNIDALRDWGYAPDYVKAMWLMMQHEKPDDFVIATGIMHSVREFIEKAFSCVNISLEWSGSGSNEIAKNKATGAIVVRIDERYFRPTEVDILCGDASKAKSLLGWEPQVTFNELVTLMVQEDLKEISSAGVSL